MIRLVSRLVAVLVLSACAGSTAGGSSEQPSAQPQPASSQLIEVLRGGQVALVDLTGRVVASTALPGTSDANTSLVPVGAGGDRAAYLDTKNGVLWALHRDGSIERLAPLTVQYWDVLLSPDGQRWAWAEHHLDTDGFVSSTLHIGSSGGDRVILALTSPDSYWRPYRWGQAGLLVEKALNTSGENVPFDTPRGDVELIEGPPGVNPDFNQILVLCHFAALAIDGTVACTTTTPSGITLKIFHPDGATSSIPLPTPRFNTAGNASFQPGSAGTLVIGGDTYDLGTTNTNEQFATSTVDVKGTAVRPFGPAGIAPAAGGDWVWLDGGLLIGMGWLHGRALDSGVWLLSPDGTARRISPGQAFGVLG